MVAIAVGSFCGQSFLTFRPILLVVEGYASMSDILAGPQHGGAAWVAVLRRTRESSGDADFI